MTAPSGTFTMGSPTLTPRTANLGGSTASTSTVGSTTLSSGDTSVGAKAAIENFFADYGIQGLGDWAWQQWTSGASIDQIMLDMRKQPAYQQAYPAMEALAKQGYAMTESQYRAQEKAYTDVMHAYGIPAGFYDTHQALGEFMTNNVSPTELQDRVKQYTTAVLGDQTTLSELSRLYGTVGHTNNPAGDLLAHYLDPNAAAPVLQHQYDAAAFSAAGQKSGYGGLSQAEAEKYLTTGQGAEQGFSDLVKASQLMNALPGEAANAVTREQQLGAAFGGSEQDRLLLQRQAELRVAENSGAAGFATSQTGVSGLGQRQV